MGINGFVALQDVDRSKHKLKKSEKQHLKRFKRLTLMDYFMTGKIRANDDYNSIEFNSREFDMSDQHSKKQLSAKVLKNIINRIVETASPEKIILFGSAVRGEMDKNSDVDLLVVVKPGVHRRKLAGEIYKKLIGVGQAVDVIVVTADDVERYKNSPALIIESALKEGKTVYAA